MLRLALVFLILFRRRCADIHPRGDTMNVSGVEANVAETQSVLDDCILPFRQLTEARLLSVDRDGGAAD